MGHHLDGEDVESEHLERGVGEDQSSPEEQESREQERHELTRWSTQFG